MSLKTAQKLAGILIAISVVGGKSAAAEDITVKMGKDWCIKKKGDKAYDARLRFRIMSHDGKSSFLASEDPFYRDVTDSNDVNILSFQAVKKSLVARADRRIELKPVEMATGNPVLVGYLTSADPDKSELSFVVADGMEAFDCTGYKPSKEEIVAMGFRPGENVAAEMEKANIYNWEFYHEDGEFAWASDDKTRAIGKFKKATGELVEITFPPKVEQPVQDSNYKSCSPPKLEKPLVCKDRLGNLVDDPPVAGTGYTYSQCFGICMSDLLGSF